MVNGSGSSRPCATGQEVEQGWPCGGRGERLQGLSPSAVGPLIVTPAESDPPELGKKRRCGRDRNVGASALAKRGSGGAAMVPTKMLSREGRLIAWKRS